MSVLSKPMTNQVTCVSLPAAAVTQAPARLPAPLPFFPCIVVEGGRHGTVHLHGMGQDQAP